MDIMKTSFLLITIHSFCCISFLTGQPNSLKNQKVTRYTDLFEYDSNTNSFRVTITVNNPTTVANRFYINKGDIIGTKKAMDGVQNLIVCDILTKVISPTNKINFVYDPIGELWYGTVPPTSVSDVVLLCYCIDYKFYDPGSKEHAKLKDITGGDIRFSESGICDEFSQIEVFKAADAKVGTEDEDTLTVRLCDSFKLALQDAVTSYVLSNSRNLFEGLKINKQNIDIKRMDVSEKEEKIMNSILIGKKDKHNKPGPDLIEIEVNHMISETKENNCKLCKYKITTTTFK